MIQPKLQCISCPFEGALRSVRRPATKAAALIAVLFFASAIARSDARVEIAGAPALRRPALETNWSIAASPRAVQQALDAARARNIVASAQSLLSTTQDDGIDTTAPHVLPLNVDVEIHARRVPIAVAPSMQFSSYLAPGQRRIIHSGRHGAAWITERVTYWNDVVVDRQLIAQQVVQKAIPDVELVGTPKTLGQLRALFPGRIVSAAMTMVATAYTADTATSEPTGYTATGVLAREGVVAVDPRVIPLGTMLFVPGYGLAVAADTGGAIIGNRIDLCMNSYGDAVTFGRQTVQVYIVKR